MNKKKIEIAYNIARDIYAEHGIDTDQVIAELGNIELTHNCWQGDDLTGFENNSALITGSVTGKVYPGKARNGQELRNDISKAFSLIPARNKINLLATYRESPGGYVDRDEIDISHFQCWLEWALENHFGIDFNPMCLNHVYFDGFSLSNPNDYKRRFWINHIKQCRRIAADIGKSLDRACVNNIWIPDGMKEVPANRLKFRSLLKDSLDEIFSEKYSNDVMLDAVESKLFGPGLESYTVGSHEFYLSYAIRNNLVLTYNTAHFHPTESIADKVSSTLLFIDKLLIHISRGVRWDSDHIPILTDDLIEVMKEIKRCNAFDRVSLSMDFFDPTKNRIAGWVAGGRAVLKAVLIAMLEPVFEEQDYENRWLGTSSFVMAEEAKSLPWQAVWNMYCTLHQVPISNDWLNDILNYEYDILSKRT